MQSAPRFHDGQGVEMCGGDAKFQSAQQEPLWCSVLRMMDHAYTLSCLGGELLIAKQTSKDSV